MQPSDQNGHLWGYPKKKAKMLPSTVLTTLHNAHIVQYLYLATEQAGTYLKSDPVCHHLTYINPTLFSCEINIENSILGTIGNTKTDVFSEKFQKGGGSFQIQK